MQEREVRWGIVGAGNIARRFAAALQSVEGGNAVAAAARSIEKTARFAAACGIPKIFPSCEELVADPEIDAVYVATPHTAHFSVAAAALKAGKAVLCEKPATLNAAEFRQLTELSHRHGAFLMEAMWTRFLPVNRRVLEWIADGEIGKVEMIYADFCFPAECLPTGRLYAPELGGGALLDIGVYPLNYAMMLAGRPESAEGFMTPTVTGVDGSNAMLLKFPNGPLALLSSSIRSGGGLQQARICGDRGTITVPEFWGAKSAALVRHGEKSPALTVTAPPELDGFVYEIREVHRLLGTGALESPLMPHEETLAVLDIMDRLRVSWHLRYPGE